MKRSQRIAVACGILLILPLCVGVVSAQDELEPRPTPDPLPLPSRVDQILNPQIALPGDVIFQFGDAALTDEQKEQIERAHILAWQQVRAALQYLQANARRIFAGKDPFYNATFGQFYDRSDRNPLLGEYDIDVAAVKTLNRPLGVAEVSDTTVTFEEDTIFLNNIQVGDPIVIGNQIHVVAEIEVDDSNLDDEEAGGIKRLNTDDDSGGGGGSDGDLPFILLESIELEEEFNDFDGAIDTDELEVRRVIGTTTVTNREHYDRVVSTFTAIRDLLELETEYTADWDLMESSFDDIFAPFDEDSFDPADGAPENVFIYDGAAYDRSFRQSGYSNSNSQAAEDQRLLDPDNPLRWTEDNDHPALDDDGNEIDDEDLLFYHDQLTIFGEFDQGGSDTEPGTNSVYVGGGFLSENQKSVGGLFNGDPSNVDKRTDLLQYQMIVAAFAEYAPFFRTDDVDDEGNPVFPVGAGFGILDILTEFGDPNGNSELPFAQNMDAEVFAAFANIFSDPRAHTGIGDGTLLPPVGKNARARSDNSILTFTFAPVIPLE